MYSVCTLCYAFRERWSWALIGMTKTSNTWLATKLQRLNLSRRLRTGDTTTLAKALARNASKEKAKLKPVTIRMLPDDLETLRRVAAEKGLPYQTYIKVLLREALRGNHISG